MLVNHSGHGVDIVVVAMMKCLFAVPMCVMRWRANYFVKFRRFIRNLHFMLLSFIFVGWGENWGLILG